MANEKMTGLNPAPVDAVAWADFIDQFEQAKVAGIGISLSEWELANTDEPEITAGSYIEISGGLYQFAALTSIVDDPGGLIAGPIYVRFEPSGDDVNPRFVNEAPVWNVTKQGWYDATELFRYSGHRIEWDGASSYSDKGWFANNPGGSGFILSPDGSILEMGSSGYTPKATGTILFNDTNPWYPPAGIYSVVVSGGTYEIFASGAWRGSQSAFGIRWDGTVISDGVNVRLRRTDGAGGVIYYNRIY